MAGMDLKLRRHDRGMSVFWMILITGAAVFVLIAILLTVGNTEHVEAESDSVVTLAEEPLPGSASFDQGETADIAPTEEGELPLDGLPDSSEVEPAPQDAAVEPEGPREALDEALTEDEPGEIVVDPGQERVFNPQEEPVDPQNEMEPFVETPSGPEGRDDEVILEE